MKIRPVGADLFHADGWTDRYDEANSRFQKFCERTEKRAKQQKISDAPHTQFKETTGATRPCACKNVMWMT